MIRNITEEKGIPRKIYEHETGKIKEGQKKKRAWDKMNTQ